MLAWANTAANIISLSPNAVSNAGSSRKFYFHGQLSMLDLKPKSENNDRIVSWATQPVSGKLSDRSCMPTRLLAKTSWPLLPHSSKSLGKFSARVINALAPCLAFEGSRKPREVAAHRL